MIFKKIFLSETFLRENTQLQESQVSYDDLPSLEKIPETKDPETFFEDKITLAKQQAVDTKVELIDDFDASIEKSNPPQKNVVSETVKKKEKSQPNCRQRVLSENLIAKIAGIIFFIGVIFLLNIVYAQLGPV